MTRREYFERNHLIDQEICHRWYTFVQAFSAQLVRSVLSKYNHTSGLILDPFVGTGTTCVECKILGIPSMGIDANPLAVFASRVKTTWDLDIEAVQHEKDSILSDIRPIIRNLTELSNITLDDLLKSHQLKEVGKIIPRLIDNESIHPVILVKCLVIKKRIAKISDSKIHDFFGLALVSTFVSSTNMRYKPETSPKMLNSDTSVLQNFEAHIHTMISDLIKLQSLNPGETQIEQGDAKQVLTYVDSETVNGVITSPPYPVDTDYTRQTHLELAILGFAQNSKDLQQIEKSMIRGSRHFLDKDDVQYEVIQYFPEIQALISEIATHYQKKGDSLEYHHKYPRLVGEYFGGMYSHLSQMYDALIPNGWAAYIVGDKLLFEKSFIRTSEILSKLATRIGYTIKGIELLQTRIATTSKISLPENILFLSK